MNQQTESQYQHNFIKQYKKRALKIRILQCCIFLFFIILWEVSTRLGIVDSFIFSSPSRLVVCAYKLSVDGTLFYHLAITIFETLLSFSLIIFIGLAVSVLLWWNKTLYKIFEPYLIVLNSLPKSALAPVFIVWLGNNMKTIIVAAVSVGVFGAVLTLFNAFNTTDSEKLKLIQTLGGNRKDMLFKVVIPSNISSIISVMKVNIGLALVGVIIGEFLAANAGLGYLIIYGSQVFKLDWVILSIVLLCILAAALYKPLSILEKKYTKPQ